MIKKITQTHEKKAKSSFLNDRGILLGIFCCSSTPCWSMKETPMGMQIVLLLAVVVVCKQNSRFSSVTWMVHTHISFSLSLSLSLQENVVFLTQKTAARDTCVRLISLWFHPIKCYSMWCLLCHIFHKNGNLTSGNGTCNPNAIRYMLHSLVVSFCL